MKRYLLPFFSLLLAVLLNSNLHAAKLVTAKGMSFFEPGREVVAREKALAEAKRAAIEQALGASIESRTVVEDFQVVKDQIFSRSSGYLSDLKILEENKTTLGTYEVKIQAAVEVSDLMADLDRFQQVLKWQKNPRISIEIEPGLAQEFHPAARKAANLLTNRCQGDGFSVFKFTKDSDIQLGLLVGLNLEHASRQTAFQDLKLTINEISLSAHIYRLDGEVLATASAVKSIPGENRLETLDKGARECVEAIWNELRKKLAKQWERELFSNRDIFFIVKNVRSHARAQELNMILKTDVSGILAADLIRYGERTAEYHLKYRGWADHLLNEIQMSYFKKKYFDLDLEKIAGNKLIIQMK